MTLRILAAADLELAEAATWYDDHRTGLGQEFLDEIKKTFDQIRSSPLLGECITQLAGHPQVRQRAVHRFPYLVIYRFAPDETLVVAVSHAHRLPFYWLKRLS